jgi:hypothetical protein
MSVRGPVHRERRWRSASTPPPIRGGLSSIGSSVAVLGTGIDIVYPKANHDLALRLAAFRLPGIGVSARHALVSGTSRAATV